MPATIVGAEQEPIRYTDYMRPPGSEGSDTTPPPPPSASQVATSRFISFIATIYVIIHLLWWTPQLAGLAHSSEGLTTQEVFIKYVKPWHIFTERWLTFSPSVTLERFGAYLSVGWPPEDKKDHPLTKITQFILPIFSHAQIFHLAFNFFALQALAPTMVRFYGFNRSLLAYLFIGSLGLISLVPYDLYLNPYWYLPQPLALTRYRATDETVIRRETKNMPTKAQTEEHYKLGEHCRPGLGGSGALYGFLAITAIVNPAAKFELMFIPVGISVRTLFMALCTADLSFIALKNEMYGTIGHLSGAAAGVLVWALWLRRVRLPPDVQRQLMMYMRKKKMGME
ncbi:hypothetical protein ABW20_dc0107741 [Dactylellina cionopaga]|nr:hypothetical protein ABW20_dc0107741 [Dactylellina cionopaga]